MPKLSFIYQRLLRVQPNRNKNAALNIKGEAIRVLRGAEENQEKSCENDLSKDTDSVLSVEELANLALSCAQ